MDKAGNGRVSMRESTEGRCHDCAGPLPTDPVIVIVDGETHPFGCESCAAGFLAGHLCLCDCFEGPWCKCQPKQRSSERV